MSILGRSQGNTFYKKFLLKKSLGGQSTTSSLPIKLGPNQHSEESTVIKTFINYVSSDGKVIESCIEKKGSNRAFTYTHKSVIEKNGQKLHKKRQISASEYIELES